MSQSTRKIPVKKTIALIAHDHAKDSLVAWVDFNRETLTEHHLCGTGTTSQQISEETGLEVEAFMSGPYGGDLQIGAKIAQGDIDLLIFFWDPMEAKPHDPDIKALLRIAAVWNIPVATNRASADFMIASNLMEKPYQAELMDFHL